MIEILFAVLMLMAFGKLLGWAIKAAWGITKILVTVILFPLVLIGMVFAGLVYLAIPIVIIVGIVALVGSATA